MIQPKINIDGHDYMLMSDHYAILNQMVAISDYFDAYEDHRIPREHPEQRRALTILRCLLPIAFIVFAIWASCSKFHGELPDGRWENAIGGGRITDVIPLEDQHGDE